MKWKISSLLFCASLANATELLITQEEARRQGYRPAGRKLRSQILRQPEEPGALPWEAHSLKWPVSFQTDADPIGNDMIQFQDYSGAYFHGGLDLVAPEHSPVIAPVSGRLEAGHYAYARTPNGMLEKFWKPWPEMGDPNYFEISLVTSEGYRFEFHHIDRDRLSPKVLSLLNGPPAEREIVVGDHLGDVVFWEWDNYHHIHYNIFDPNGIIRVNPEHLSPLMRDTKAPTLVAAAYQESSEAEWKSLTAGASLEKLHEIQIVCRDERREAGYSHPPAYTGLHFASGHKIEWDFRKHLATAAFEWPDIWAYYSRFLRVDESTWETWGDYGAGEFIVRLPVPDGAEGSFVVRLRDQNANETLLEAEKILSQE
jgi:hypothetical protein